MSTQEKSIIDFKPAKAATVINMKADLRYFARATFVLSARANLETIL